MTNYAPVEATLAVALMKEVQAVTPRFGNDG